MKRDLRRAGRAGSGPAICWGTWMATVSGSVVHDPPRPLARRDEFARRRGSASRSGRRRARRCAVVERLLGGGDLRLARRPGRRGPRRRGRRWRRRARRSCDALSNSRCGAAPVSCAATRSASATVPRRAGDHLARPPRPGPSRGDLGDVARCLGPDRRCRGRAGPVPRR